MRNALWATGLIVAALLLALPAAANEEIDNAKRSGWIGEQADGFLGVVPGAPASAGALVNRVNSGRAAKYAEIARQNGTTPAAVGALAGEKLVARARAGEWVRDASGNWRQR